MQSWRARLYNAGINSNSLQKAFGTDRKTMKRCGEALKSGDTEKLLGALGGRGAPRKVTPEIESYIGMRFPSVYRETRYQYSKRIRDEVEQVFGKRLSPETVRPLLKELKQQAAMSPNSKPASSELPGDCAFLEAQSQAQTALPKRENSGDSGPAPAVASASQLLVSRRLSCQHSEALGADNRKESPAFAPPTSDAITMCHHVGVLIFSAVLQGVEQSVEDGGWLLKQ